MKNKITGLLFVSSLITVLALVSCGGNNEDVSEDLSKPFAGKTLTIYNCDDYISSGDEEYKDVIAEFENETGCTINYYTYDTNETMYNQFTLQKEGTYDLICTSDYMIQKMVKEDLIVPFDDIATQVPNYEQYASQAIRSKLRDMEVQKDDKVVNLDSYAVGYMWGTLGLIYDSEYTETIQEDVKSWNILWDSTYKDVISLKNSMRDTYVVGLMHHYSNEDEYFNQLKEAYLKDDASQADLDAYNNYIQDIFDFKLDGSSESDKENKEKIQIVKEELISVKKNIFGFEVDSGKNDIITGKIKINLAWSGDACYSIDTAIEERDGELNLEYYVPDDGGNIWYDAWTLPKGGQVDLACAFLDYLSCPENAAVNMDYVGYTPFIVGDEIFDLTANWYGPASYSSTYEYCYDKEKEIQDYCIYNNTLYRCIQSSIGGILPTNEDYFESNEFNSSEEYIEGDMVSFNGKIYTCIAKSTINSSINDEETWLENEGYDLSYLFSGSLEEGKSAIIYPYLGIENKLSCQYPDEKTVARCGIMNDFGTYNDAVIIMWGQVRAYTNMVPYYTLLSVVLVAVLGLAIYSLISKKLSARNKRNLTKKSMK